VGGENSWAGWRAGGLAGLGWPLVSCTAAACTDDADADRDAPRAATQVDRLIVCDCDSARSREGEVVFGLFHLSQSTSFHLGMRNGVRVPGRTSVGEARAERAAAPCN